MWYKHFKHKLKHVHLSAVLGNVVDLLLGCLQGVTAHLEHVCLLLVEVEHKKSSL